MVAIQKEVIPCTDFRIIVLNGNQVHETKWDDECKLCVRRLDSMTEEEMRGLLISMTPPDMEDAPDAEDYDLEMFYNDGGNNVDADVAVGANCTCICWEGQIAVRYNGDIDLFDEEGKRDRVVNQTAAFHYLLSRGFWMWGDDWFDEGLIIDKNSLRG